jgi:hypothetical protein
MPEWAQVLSQENRGIGFVQEAFPDRELVKLYYDEGYLLILRKEIANG